MRSLAHIPTKTVTSGYRAIKDGSRYNSYFPPPDERDRVIIKDGEVTDTVELMEKVVWKYLDDTKRIAPLLRRPSTHETCQAIWEFIHNFIQYKLDQRGLEQLRRPARSWAERATGVDCDCMSIFTSSILTNLKINRLQGYSVVESYFDSLPINDDGQGLEFHFDQTKDFAGVASKLPKAFVAMALGGNFETKQMPANLVVKIIDKLNIPVVLLGGENEKLKAKEISNTCKTVIDLVGKLSLQESAFVISLAQKVISNDTGLMHIAAAFNKPMAVVWGSTVREFGFSPVYAKGFENRVKHFEVADLKCRPCSKLGHKKCPKGHFECMQSQDIEAISEWSNNGLDL